MIRRQKQAAHLPVSGLKESAWAPPPLWPVSGLASKSARPSHANAQWYSEADSRRRRRLFTVAGAAHVGWRGPAPCFPFNRGPDGRASTKTWRLYVVIRRLGSMGTRQSTGLKRVQVLKEYADFANRSGMAKFYGFKLNSTLPIVDQTTKKGRRSLSSPIAVSALSNYRSGRHPLDPGRFFLQVLTNWPFF